jgi:4-amino-4-deoxy-L-arabinose transferase-like glycosyltransferase
MRKKRYRLIKQEVTEHKLIYILLTLILLGAFFVRVYRVSDLLQFYYDQGRDALVIWKLWHEGKPFLIGPITGLTGIFLGPFYYYLIAPFYLVGGGDPSYPAVFLSFLSVSALGVIYYLGWQMQSQATGLIAATIGGFSYYMMLAGRWLSNPTPILLTSSLLLLSLWKIAVCKNRDECKWWWVGVSFLTGISMQFESASAVFYIPMVIVFTIWQWKKFPPLSQLFISIGIFLLTLLPQIAFNYRHANILFNNFWHLFGEEKSFRGLTEFILAERKKYFWNVFSSKIFLGDQKYAYFFTLMAFVGLLFNWKKNAPQVLPLFLIFLGVPILGYLFFQGNYGNIYDYYMTGYYLPLLLIFSIGLASFWKNWIGKIVILLFFTHFLTLNIPPIKSYLTHGYSIRLGTEVPAVNWVFNSAAANAVQEYNVDVYVPPVISYSYDYLFLWQGTKKCGKSMCGLVKDKNVNVIYLLYEEDNENPKRLSVWLDRYKENTSIDEKIQFGGITVERRKRI